MVVSSRLSNQRLKGDKYNLMPGVVLVFVLACCKELKQLPTVIRFQLNTYTNWNLALIGLRFVLDQPQWEPFLAVNSMSLNVGFRTAMAQGLAENMRKKLKAQGLSLPKFLFILADHMVHTLPAVGFLAKLVSERRRIPYVNCMYASILATYFAFRQEAKLDASGIYVPHPWVRAWAGIVTGILVTPLLNDALIDGHRARAAAATLALFAPWCTTRFDPSLRNKYMLEYAIQSTGSPASPRDRGRGNSVKDMRRVQSEL